MTTGFMPSYYDNPQVEKARYWRNLKKSKNTVKRMLKLCTTLCVCVCACVCARVCVCVCVCAQIIFSYYLFIIIINIFIIII